MLWIFLLRLLAIVAVGAIGYYIYRQIRYHQDNMREITRQIKEVVRVAAEHEGKVTVAQLAFEMDIALEEAEKLINFMIKRRLAELSLDEEGGDFVYEVPLSLKSQKAQGMSRLTGKRKSAVSKSPEMG
jgi:hypothetical protein